MEEGEYEPADAMFACMDLRHNYYDLSVEDRDDVGDEFFLIPLDTLACVDEADAAGNEGDDVAIPPVPPFVDQTDGFDILDMMTAQAARIEGELEDQEIIDAGEGSRVRGAHTSAEASRWVAFNHEAVPEIEFASSEIEIGLVSFTDRWAWNAL